MYRLTSLLFLISISNGLQLQGPCDSTNITHILAVDVKEVVGKWYEIERIPNNYQKGDCPSWTITGTIQNDATSPIDISIQEVVDGKVVTRDGNITTAGNGIFQATFSDGILPFVILKTNYKEYAILYSCTNQNANSEVLAWKLSRTQVTSNTTKTAFEEYTDLSKGGNWTLLSHTASACKAGNNAINIHISPVILLIAGFLITKELF
ncbi:apolipoprotein D-like [Nymphalis io]|uniref:apolipoprotein D-like n=1 Tax=Inachis io TaxID=171585 RepID=UPI002167D45D|nr:apolipoprotein D-like [Nymphalis io]